MFICRKESAISHYKSINIVSCDTEEYKVNEIEIEIGRDREIEQCISIRNYPYRFCSFCKQWIQNEWMTEEKKTFKLLACTLVQFEHSCNVAYFIYYLYDLYVFFSDSRAHYTWLRDKIINGWRLPVFFYCSVHSQFVNFWLCGCPPVDKQNR